MLKTLVGSFKVGAKTSYFHSELRNLRLAEGLTQRQLGAKIKIGLATISQIECLTHWPTPIQQKRLAKFFGKVPAELFPLWTKELFLKERTSVTREIEITPERLDSSREAQLLLSEQNPVEDYEREELGKKVHEVLLTLNPREKQVIELRFGLDGEGGKTLEAIGKIFGVNRERIRQIEAKALRKLRHTSRSMGLTDFVDRVPVKKSKPTTYNEDAEDVKDVEEYEEAPELKRLRHRSLIADTLRALENCVFIEWEDYSDMWCLEHHQPDYLCRGGKFIGSLPAGDDL